MVDEVLARAARERMMAVSIRRAVQLGACEYAARGATGPLEAVKPESYGWSREYQAVLDLRRQYDELAQKMSGRAHLKPYDLEICARPGCVSPRYYNIHDPERGGHVFWEPGTTGQPWLCPTCGHSEMEYGCGGICRRAEKMLQAAARGER